MKASKILAGLSAVSLAASMLSMVAASADDGKPTAEGSAPSGITGNWADGNTEDEDFATETETETSTETGAVADSDYNKLLKKNFGGYPWYPSVPTMASMPGFPGWPGWYNPMFPAGWQWFEKYKEMKNTVWEVYGTKDNDVAAPGYLVFEFKDGHKRIAPVGVDSNGQYVTDEIFVPFMEVQEVYFLYEIGEAPNFNVKLDAFNVNGKDVEINKDLMIEQKWNIADDNGEDIVEEFPTFYKGTIFRKGDKNLPINHGLILWGTTVKVTFTVTGIGTVKVHDQIDTDGDGKVDRDNTDTLIGDNKGDVHTHIEPEMAGGKNVTDQQVRNLDVDAINPMFGSTETRSEDLYDALKAIHDADPTQDAEISFKTYADKAGVLVAQFLNVWELDTDKAGNAAHWLKEFDEQGHAIYVELKDAKKEANDTKYNSATYYQGVQAKDINGNLLWVEVNGKKEPQFETYEKDGVKYYRCVQKTVEVSSDINDYGKKSEDVGTYVKLDGTEVSTGSTGDVIVYEQEDPNDPKKTILVMNMEPKPLTYYKDNFKYLVPKDPVDIKPWAYANDIIFEIVDDANSTAEEKYNAYDALGLDVFEKDGKFYINAKGLALTSDGKGYLVPVGSKDGKWIYAENAGLLGEDKVEEAYCWHPYFVTENGLVDVVTKNYLGDYRTDVPAYTALSDAEIKYLSEKNGMYYNDNIHSAAYGHFVVFGDNTLREYKYRIKADAVNAILEKVKRSEVKREDFVMRHGADDIEGFNKDWESMNYLDPQAEKDPTKYDKANFPNADPFGFYHHRAVHGAIWLQCCEGTRLYDVAVHPYTTILKQDAIPTLYGKEDFAAMYPKKPADSAAAAAGAAAQPTAEAAPADNNAENGAAAGFGIAGLLLAGAAMVVAKKKSN